MKPHYIIMNYTSTCASVCNKLLRGEISAIESYQKAHEKTEDLKHKESLQLIMEEHRKSADALRQHISSMGAVPDTDSGAWGNFAETVTAAAALLGQSPVMAALIQGEEHGISEYEQALLDTHVMEEIKIVFRETLIPRLQKHISVLKSLRG